MGEKQQLQPIDRIIREREARAITGLGRTTRWQLERRGLFPPRRRLTGRVSGYLASEIEEWLRSRPVSGPQLPRAAGQGVDSAA